MQNIIDRHLDGIGQFLRPCDVPGHEIDIAPVEQIPVDILSLSGIPDERQYCDLRMAHPV